MRPPGRAYSVLWGLLALGCGLALTGWLFHLQRQQRRAGERAAVQALADKGYVELRSKLRSAGLLVRAVQTMLLTDRPLDGAGFDRLYTNLRPREAFPSLLALAYVQREHGTGGDRYVTTLVAPLAGNEEVVGLDVSRQPANLGALERTRDTNQIAMSRPFELVQGQSGGSSGRGIILRLPDYRGGVVPPDVATRRRLIRGSIGASFRADELVAKGLPEEVLAAMLVRVDDITGTTPETLARFTPAGSRRAGPGGTPLVRQLEFGGRRWRLVMTPVALPGRLPWSQSVVPAGVLASVLLGLLVWSLTDTRARALDLGWRIGQRYRESEERFRTLNEVLPALVLLVDADEGTVTYANQAARARLGAHMPGTPVENLFDASGPAFAELLADAAGSSGEVVLRHAQGERFWASASVSWLIFEGRRHWVVVASDITEQRALTELLSYQATHDEMTGLLNRREFERVLARIAGRIDGQPPHAALLYVDLDQFKLVNDTSGHVAGDQLLTQLATLMRAHLGEHDQLARLGGDEFGVVLAGVPDRTDALRRANVLRRHLQRHVFVWEDKRYMVTVSIGGVLLDRAGLAMAELLAVADTACYMAKEYGRNRVHFHSEEDEDSARRRNEMEWANRLRWAVEQQRFVLAYQEVRPLGTPGAGTRMELLLRFRDEDGRLVAPGAFIPAAERYGLMPQIDRWVIATALAHFGRLHPAGRALDMVAINLSGASVEDQGLAEDIVQLLVQHEVPPQRVCFEITETVAVRQLTQVARFVSRLREAGCRVALDDFGAGMSSFAYLKHLPVDIIKIDGSFVRDMLTDPISHAMVRAVTDIGHRLGLQVVAEWVADPATMDALVELGVDLAQGFGLHQPELVVFQRDDRPVPAARPAGG